MICYLNKIIININHSTLYLDLTLFLTDLNLKIYLLVLLTTIILIYILLTLKAWKNLVIKKINKYFEKF